MERLRFLPCKKLVLRINVRMHAMREYSDNIIPIKNLEESRFFLFLGVFLSFSF